VLFYTLLLPYILFEKYILALEMASPGNRHCANCIDQRTFTFPVELVCRAGVSEIRASAGPRRQVLDDRGVRRRFRASSMASTTKVGHLACTLPLKLTDGWNDVQINLAELTQRLYATQYVETTRLQVSASPAATLTHTSTPIGPPITGVDKGGSPQWPGKKERKGVLLSDVQTCILV